MAGTSFVSPGRRTLLKTIGAGAAGLAVLPLAPPAHAAVPAAASLLPEPPQHVPPLLDRRKVDVALAGLDGSVNHAMETTGVPGVAVAVVYRDQVLYSRGFGVREAGRPEKVDP
ncbi:serine hydrolase, partial [Arthrobacter deserti]|nr:serine hydrolase [Arthrobacter deserti]